MALHRPRRIFRGSAIRQRPASGPGPVAVLMLVALAGAGIGAGLLMAGAPADLFGPRARAGRRGGGGSAACRGGGWRQPCGCTTWWCGCTAWRRRGAGRPAADGQGTGYDCGAAASAALADLVREPPRGLPAERARRGRPGAGRVRGGRHASSTARWSRRAGRAPTRAGPGSVPRRARAAERRGLVAQRGEPGLLSPPPDPPTRHP